ncbi:MAG TPA: cobalamin-binding protein [Zeimonas sp.]
MRLVDDAKRTIDVPPAPLRIVSLAPHATELLFAVGAGARVVAVDRNSDEPPAARALPKLSSFPQPDVEAMLALSPDLVVAWGPGVSSAQLQRLESLGIAVFVSDPHTLDDVASTLRRFARLAADPSTGGAVADAFEARLASLRARYARLRPVRVFVQIWSTPLITVSDAGPIGDALRSCGAVNVFGDVGVAAPQPDAEAVLARRPDLIVATDPSPSSRRWAAYGLLAPQGPAHFAAFDASTFERPGPRSLDALERLCVEIDSVRAGLRR